MELRRVAISDASLSMLTTMYNWTKHTQCEFLVSCVFSERGGGGKLKCWHRLTHSI